MTDAGGPAVAVAEKVTAATAVPVRDASTRCGDPGVAPKVHWTVVAPELVVGPLGLERLPPPSVTAKLTVTPTMGLLPASTTLTTSGCGRVAPTAAVCPSPPCLISWAAA